MAATSGLSILVAEDNDIDRTILEAILRKEGHQVLTAKNGIDAVSCYSVHRPAIVLMDALMPEMDGFEAVRHIREMAGETLVPVIFLTSLTDTPSLLKCLEAGGDDFLSKPYNRVILQAKIKAFNRMREMHLTMQEQRNQISRHHNLMLQEQKIARQLFDNIAHEGCLNADNIRYYLSSMAIFNGDILVAAMTPQGNMMVLLGDFTGHGLPAAMGAMPLAMTFYGMVHKGFSLQEILREINIKLKLTLPVGFFCCATMVEIDMVRQRLSVWNGGLPDAVIYRPGKGIRQRIRSAHLPLGVVGDQQFQMHCEFFDMAPGDRFYMWSDGVPEAMNQQGEMFGEERLLGLFTPQVAGDAVFDRLLAEVTGFAGNESRQDDISLFEITMPAAARAAAKAPLVLQDQDWHFYFVLRPDTLKNFDPLPLLLRVLKKTPRLAASATYLYTILAELYSNALEHGLLRLASDIKHQPDGFRRYYQQRNTRLQVLAEGEISFNLDCRASGEQGALRIRVTDSGEGFDVQQVFRDAPQEGPSGRGLRLLSRLCDELIFHGQGNDVEVVYRWQDPPCGQTEDLP